MDLQTAFLNFIKKNNLFQQKDKLLLAVSGGVDSVVLCDLCKKSGFDFSIAHCNFKLRGADSDRDEQFVKELAERYAVPLFIKAFDTFAIAKEQKKGIEATARDLRYEWFYSILKKQFENTDNNKTTPVLPPHDYLLTAHHADDNIETVLMNFFRGTGIKGMRGILPKQNQIIRPLLFARKKELEKYAGENKLEYVNDYTNGQDVYTRNYFRNKFIPMLAENFPETEENIINNISRMQETEMLYEQAIEQHKKKLLEFKGNEIHIPVLKLKRSTPVKTILYEIIKNYGFAAKQTDDVIGLFESESGKFVSSSTHRIIKNRKWLIIAPEITEEAETIIIDSEGSCNFPAGIIQVETTTNYQPPTTNFSASLSAKTIQFPLILRKWKQGDYFYPLGMKKKKKLARFFIDEKLSKTEKENIWVIEMDKKIIWVIGHRIDDRFKIADNTKSVLQITFKKKDA